MADPSSQWWSKETIAVVTGSNKGLGFAIARGLALQGVTTILTARDEQRGLEAVDSLKKDKAIDPSAIHFHLLDVTSSPSIQDFAAWIKNKFGGLDILVNNAGSGSMGVPKDVAKSKAVIDTNFTAVMRLTDALIPLMRPSPHGSRIINISSGTSRLDLLGNKAIAAKIADVDNLSINGINEIIKEYLDDVDQGRIEEKGWASIAGAYDYCFSKLVLNAYSRVLARDLEQRPEGHKIYVNCMCPGMTGTDMTRNYGHSAQFGADTAIWLALLPAAKSKSGCFFSKRKDVGFERIPFYLEGVAHAHELEDFMAYSQKFVEGTLVVP